MGAPLKLSLLIEANATSLKAEAAQSVAAIKGIGAAGTQSSPALSGLAKAQEEVAAEAKRARDALTGAGAAQAAAARNTALARHEVQNLSRQLSDVSTMLLSGSSPFQVFATQAGQIGDIMGKRSLGSIAAGVGTALTEMVNPATIALGAVTALYYGASWAFSAISDDAGAANKSLEEQDSLIKRVAQSYREGAPAITAFYAERERQQQQQDVKDAGAATIGQIYAPARDIYAKFHSEQAGAQLNLQSIAKPEEVEMLSRLARELNEAMASAAPTGEAAQRLQSTYQFFSQKYGTPIFDDTAKSAGTLAASLDQAHVKAVPVQDDVQKITSGAARTAGQIKALAREVDGYVGALERLKQAGTPDLSPVQRIAANFQKATLSGFMDARDLQDARRDRDAALRQERVRRNRTRTFPELRPDKDARDLAGEDRYTARVPLPTERPNDLDREQSAIERLNKSQDDRLAKLRLEAELVGQSEEVRTRRLAALDAEQQIRQQGAEGQDAENIRRNAAAIAEETIALNKRTEARQANLGYLEEAERLRLETALIGQSEAARSRAMATLEAEQEVRRRGLETGSAEAQQIRDRTLATAAETLALRQRTAAYDMAKSQKEEMVRLRLETSLVGQSEAVRVRALAAQQAEIEMARRGIDLGSERAEQIRQSAAALAEQHMTLDRSTAAWERFQSAGESAIDGVVDRLSEGDIGGALSGLADDIKKTVLEMGVANPLKNALLGTNNPTLGGLGGIVGRIFGLGGSTDAASSIASAIAPDGSPDAPTFVSFKGLWSAA